MNVVVIAPHPDDESIGCGGTLSLHTLKGDRVTAVYLTSGEFGLKQMPPAEACLTREAEARKAAKILGLADPLFLRLPDWQLADHLETAARSLAPLLKRESPELIYVPHPLEWHPDHKAAVRICWAALDQINQCPTVRAYEIWTPLSVFDHLENVDSTMPHKLRAIRAHRSQLAQLPYDRAIRGLNEYRGTISGRCRFAEVFQILTRPNAP
jgi:LmbE family N-acetylglucosaminyl deacetylase